MADNPKLPEQKVKLPIGIQGADLKIEERPIPADQPTPWGPNAELRLVGKPTRRVDGALKVTGRARYTTDVQLPGLLWARRICSPYPHARIKSIDTTKAEKHPGFKALHLLDKPIGFPHLADPAKELASPYPILRFLGQPIGAVAATSPGAADEIVRLVEIDYETLPFTVELDEARGAKAPLVFPAAIDVTGSAAGGGAAANLEQHGNVRGPARATRGDVAKGFAEAEVVFENEYRTQVQTHSCMETHGAVADWKPDRLTVWASTQWTGSFQDDLVKEFGLPKEKVRVLTEFMGGGFGSKVGAGHYGILAAQLSKKAGAPVRLVLDRAEEHQSAGNRPASLQRLKVGAKKDGTLTALQLTSFGTGGVNTGAGVGAIAEQLYTCPNFSGEQSDVFTNAGPGTAFRAPGFAPGAFALEQAIDELAVRLGIDPLALRDRIDTNEASGALARREERRLAAERFGWSRRRAPNSDKGPIKRGLGMAQGTWPRHVFADSSIEVRLLRDGTIEARSSVQDIGTGARAVIAQVVAEELGVEVKDVVLNIGDTDFPRGPLSAGSMTTNAITPPARDAAAKVKQQLFALVAPSLKVAPDELALVDGAVVVRSRPASRMPLKKAAALIKGDAIAATCKRALDYAVPAGVIEVKGWGGVQFTELSVDTETGMIRIERIVAAHDCGRPINPKGIESQVNGGVIQGISYALFEDRTLDRNTGRMVNANLEQYKIAGVREIPPIEVVIIEDYRGRSSTDAGGIGEPATVPTASSIANAFYNATGVRLRTLPMTPDRVLAALASAKKEGRP
jgi:xanthine dehydrogenase YagR molybdenum-binding subunit